MDYIKSCEMCRKTFVAKRKDNRFCCSSCKNRWHRTLSDFDVIQKWVPEKIVQQMYYEPYEDYHCIYLNWFKDGEGNRFADVYGTKDSKRDYEKHFTGQTEFPIKYVGDRKTIKKPHNM